MPPAPQTSANPSNIWHAHTWPAALGKYMRPSIYKYGQSRPKITKCITFRD